MAGKKAKKKPSRRKKDVTSSSSIRGEGRNPRIRGAPPRSGNGDEGTPARAGTRHKTSTPGAGRAMRGGEGKSAALTPGEN